MRHGILTVTTDFGASGPYVAAMKGIILAAAPETQIVDVSHEIAPQNILEGAFVLAGIVDAFPPETVHLAVIDPGVGTPRLLVAARIADQWFVLPDNGLLSGLLRDRPTPRIHEITNPAIWRSEVSATFHGRDILAPAAAFLLRGGDPDQLGPRRQNVIRLANFEPRADEHGLLGEVIFRDNFGNLITNVAADRLAGQDWHVEIAGERVSGLSRAYGDHPPGTLVALIGGSKWLEVALVNGDAARHLSAGPGTTVKFRRIVKVRPKTTDPA
jgi:S-adenosylmethionine hydrolase